MSGAEQEPIRVQLDATDVDLQEPASVADQIPSADTLPAGTRVTVLAMATREGGVLRRLLGRGTVPVPTATRATALLVRGYVRLAEVHGDTQGTVPG